MTLNLLIPPTTYIVNLYKYFFFKMSIFLEIFLIDHHKKLVRENFWTIDFYTY